MNILPPQNRCQRALTLIDVLIVIAIIFVLASLVLPNLSSTGRLPRGSAPVEQVKMKSLATAIQSYEAAYNHLPWTDSNTNEDVTLGIDPANLIGFQKITGTRLIASNSDLIIILMDIDVGVNAGHKMNPQRHVYLEPEMAKKAGDPGVSTTDYQYRDARGNPYIISLDANQDGWTRDAFYSSPVVSSKQLDGPLKDNDGAYEAAGGIMIWSRGPDGKADPNIPANTGVNKDNITSWQ